jgi:hypothetical protein
MKGEIIMAYTKKTWVKGNTPLSAENFNHMEQGIADAHTDIAQLNSDTKSIIQFLGNMTTPNNSEGIIHANWPDNMVPVAIRVKKYDQWRYNVLGMALYGKELYLIEIPSAYQGCPCEVICYKSN